MTYYFTSETDQAIREYLVALSDVNEKLRNEIFNTRIRPAFEKLIESQIFVYRFYSIDDVETLKKEALANLFEMLPKFDPNRGAKGFSYFNVVAKNWFIQKNREKNKRLCTQDTSCDLEHDVVKNSASFSLQPFEDDVMEREFWLLLFQDMDRWRPLLVKKHEIQVLDAIVYLMRNPTTVSIHNKKAVYLYLRELTGLTLKTVVVDLKRIKSLYDEFKERFDEDGE
jgi:hypothetical protein